MTHTNEATVRFTARQAVIDSVSERASYEHQPHFHKLHIYRDGGVHWTVSINQSDDIIDSGAGHFAAIPSVACVGTGSYACNCEFCNDVYSAQDEAYVIEQGRKYDKLAKYGDHTEAIAAAVGESDLQNLEDDMVAKFDQIPAGYFFDECEVR
jgi:hypothetical protein